MSTVINNPGDNRGESSGVSMIIGVILVIVLGVLFVLYVLPMIQNQAAPATTEIQVNLPEIPTTETAPAAGQ